ncbi:MAG TPA: helicase-related protein [Terracidiphilus sp.]|nr:helicase-related protein [Terracidiphilus sp.]
MTAPDTAAVLGSLKDFQRRTVDYVFDRLYGRNAVQRFLVADEVGLGKTLVARGVIARAVEHLWDGADRIEIIYICSNADIARQNISRLAIPGCGVEEMRATRLSLMPLESRDRGQERVNFIALTPGTSFELTGGGGWAKERALLYRLLRDAWGLGDKAAPWNVLAEYGRQSFEREFSGLADAPLDAAIAGSFIRRIRSNTQLRVEFDELCQIYPRSDSHPQGEERLKRHRWLGRMRTEITRVCIESIRPSLIIMDEFQRFRNLLDEETPSGKLAAGLFGCSGDGEKGAPRTLLLSATPYKMLSMHHEQDEDHYRDLLDTLAFLDGRETLPRWKALFGDYQRATLRYGETQDERRRDLTEFRDRLAQELRRVMVRTEKLAASPERGGMLIERDMAATDLSPDDVRAFFALQETADMLDQGDCIEYWKSAPYVLNFMDRYQLDKAFHEACSSVEHGWEMHKLVRKHAGSFLPVSHVRGYRAIPSMNVRFRALQRETLDTGAWKMLWIPPACPYHELGGVFGRDSTRGFTKSLIFSAWHVVPKAVSALLSYEAERRMMRVANPKGQLAYTAAARKRRRPLLRFAQSEGRLTGLPLFTLVYPCLSLAKIADPLEIARELGGDHPPSLKNMLVAAEKRIAPLLLPLTSDAPTSGPEDEAWYWLAPMLLDGRHSQRSSSKWWAYPELAREWMLTQDADEAQQHDAWEKHVAEAREMARSHTLGRPPGDLAILLAQVAVAAPATCALRAFCRDEVAAGVVATRLAAARVGHAFLALFNLPESRSLLQGMNSAEPYWRRVLEYACDGGLQAVLDEFVHLLREDRCVEPAKLSEDVCEALRLRTSILRADDISAPEGRRRVAINLPDDNAGEVSDEDKETAHLGVAMRVRFAMRFGDDRAETEATGNRRETVRHAFNSPFWPFVLVTTSVGQEGLDFHRYCHRVVHWNLPSNPVDFEQREGRVHRYKGHAVRKNVSQQHRIQAIGNARPDIWDALFEAVTRKPGESELVPYWVYPGEAKIERCVPSLPMSREVTRLAQLRCALTIYRMAFGHARQEDVIEHLLARVRADQHASFCEASRIDLAPPEKTLPNR